MIAWANNPLKNKQVKRKEKRIKKEQALSTTNSLPGKRRIGLYWSLVNPRKPIHEEFSLVPRIILWLFTTSQFSYENSISLIKCSSLKCERKLSSRKWIFTRELSFYTQRLFKYNNNSQLNFQPHHPMTVPLVITYVKKLFS